MLIEAIIRRHFLKRFYFLYFRQLDVFYVPGRVGVRAIGLF